jgi:O-antigen/teichoic acid export membrane protein
MANWQTVKDWLRSQRSSVRIGFALQVGSRALSSVLALLWTPLLLHAMGKALNGAFLSLHSLATLGGLGDLGMGGMVSIQTSRLLGRGDEAGLRSLLSAVRGLFLILTMGSAALFLFSSPLLFRSLGFASVAGIGGLPMLAAVGALATGAFILSSYVNNLNHGCGNVMWPVLPGFFLMQLTYFLHWVMASHRAPLWAQYLAYLFYVLGILGLNWYCVRCSHPWLAGLRPLVFDRKEFLSLATKSFWVYLYCLANGVYTTTGRLFINAGFGPELLPAYQYNSRLCELAFIVISSASLASTPKITQWLASPEPGLRQRALREASRLNKLQTLLGCAAVLIYLAINDVFIAFWLGPDFKVPSSWQTAFAANLGVMTAGLVGYDLAARCCDHGLKVGGLTVAGAALVNLVISLVAVQRHEVLGVAIAAALAQSIATLGLGWFTCTQTGLSWWHLSLKNWLVTLSAVGVGLGLKLLLPGRGLGGILLMAAGLLLALTGCAILIGLKPGDFFDEWRQIRNLMQRPQKPDKA